MPFFKILHGRMMGKVIFNLVGPPILPVQLGLSVLSCLSSCQEVANWKNGYLVLSKYGFQGGL